MTRWAEQHFVALGATRRRVGGKIVRTEVGLDLNNAAGQNCSTVLTDDQFSQQLAGDHTRIAVEEGTSENLGFRLFLQSRAERGAPIPSYAAWVGAIHRLSGVPT